MELETHAFGMSDADVLTILEGLAQKRVAIVEAGTGTGKSTFMPFRLLNPPPGAAFLPTAAGPIIVTEPRRAAATGVARFVGEELCHGCDSRRCSRHIGPGFPVGYQVSGEQHWDAACELIYVTDGTMINWIRDGRLARLGMVIIDEAHERSENIDIILAQLRDAVRQHEHLRVLITSATLDRSFFEAYFGGPERVFHAEIPAAKSFGYGVPLFVGADINEDVIRAGMEIGPGVKFPGWARRGPAEESGTAEDLWATTRKLANLRCVNEIPNPDLRWRQDMPDAVVRQVVAIASETSWGDILAFLPTDRVIRDVVARIERQLSGGEQEFDVYPLLSTVKPDIAQKAIAARSRGDRRKVVVSSNLAETSLTVKGVRFVVDSGLICQAEWDPQLASGSFPTKPHSQSGLRQRWGRVGRDAPGWVFPLYSAEQFLSLAKNTPPETAQSNLETFYMKLISSGLDVDPMTLPGGFVPGDTKLDKAGQDNVDLFVRESARARDALARSGAVDGDGHLTAFGREIERFPGEGSHALAVMLADQLACVHEVTLALEVLTEGALYGNDPDCILGVDEEWPAAWRVRAAEAHRGLAVGCCDDLDVLLRVVSLWQTRDDREEWCAKWWINGDAIAQFVRATEEQIGALSAAMKQDATRPVRSELAGRARAVLSRALVSARYRHVSDSTWTAEGEADQEKVRLSRGLVPAPSKRILALNRFRRGVQRGDEVRPAEISHIVELIPWALLDAAGHDDIGLDLMVLASTGLHPQPLERELRCRALCDLAPVGALVSVECSGDGLVQSLRILREPDPHPSAQHGVGRQHRTTSGFDREWDPSRLRIGIEPEDEASRRIEKAQLLETNDEVLPTGQAQSSEPLSVELPQLVAVDDDGQPLTVPTIARVSGFRWDDRAARLILEPRLGGDTNRLTPEHSDLTPWAQVDAIVGRVTWDHGREYLRLERADRRGTFFIADWGAAPELHDLELLRRLIPGAQLTVRTVPDTHGGLTATLLPWARFHLAQAPSEGRNWDDGRVRAYPAKVVAAPDAQGWAMAELDHCDQETGLTHRFRVRDKALSRLGYDAPSGGEPLMLVLGPLRGERRAILKVSRPEIAEIAKRESALELRNDSVRVGAKDVPFQVISALVRASPAQLRDEVWKFYEDSLHLSVRAVLPPSFRAILSIPEAFVGALIRSREALAGEHGVWLSIRRDELEMEVGAQSQAALTGAIAGIQHFVKQPVRKLRIQDWVRGWLLGSGQANLRRLRDIPGILDVTLAELMVTAIGTSGAALDQLVAELPRRSRGIFSVPQGKAGLLIGKGGATIRELCDRSDVYAKNAGRDGTWLLDAKSDVHINIFIALASEKVPGSTGYLTSEKSYEIASEAPVPKLRIRIPDLSVEAPDFLVDVDDDEAKRLAALPKRTS